VVKTFCKTGLPGRQRLKILIQFADGGKALDIEKIQQH
jgi:hypothetical protein